MTNYFSNHSDQELLELVEAYSLEYIPLKHPIRQACFDLNKGKEDAMALLATAVYLMKELASRLRWSIYINEL